MSAPPPPIAVDPPFAMHLNLLFFDTRSFRSLGRKIKKEATTKAFRVRTTEKAAIYPQAALERIAVVKVLTNGTLENHVLQVREEFLERGWTCKRILGAVGWLTHYATSTKTIPSAVLNPHSCLKMP